MLNYLQIKWYLKFASKIIPVKCVGGNSKWAYNWNKTGHELIFVGAGWIYGIWGIISLFSLRTMVLEKTLESPLDCKEIQPVHPTGDQAWVFIGRNDVEAETSILRPPDAKSWLTGREGLRAGGEGDDRGWDGWVASSTRWTWVWVDSRNWWWTGRPGMLQFMGLQSRTWLSDWTELMYKLDIF